MYNCHLKAFSELEVTNTRNAIFRILVPFQCRLLIIVTASCCERVFLTCHLQTSQYIFSSSSFNHVKFSQPSWPETPLFFLPFCFPGAFSAKQCLSRAFVRKGKPCGPLRPSTCRLSFMISRVVCNNYPEGTGGGTV